MAFREAILLLVVGASCLLALFRPTVGLYAYIWFGLMRPDGLAWVEGKYPFSLALAVCTLLGAVPYASRVATLFKNPFIAVLLIMQFPIALSIVFSEGPFLAWDRYDEYLRTLVMSLVIFLLIRTETHLRQLLLVMALSLGTLGAKFGLWGLYHGGVLFHDGHANIYDNNTLAQALAMAVPLCWYSRNLLTNSAVRHTAAAVILPCAAAVLMTESRSAILSLGIVMIVIAYRSRSKILTFALLLGMTLPTIHLVSDRLTQRMETVINYENEASAMSRIAYAKAAFAMWRDYPILGVGFGARNYSLLKRRYLPDVYTGHNSHNSYLQVLVDMGIGGFLCYSFLLFGSIWWLWRSSRALESARTDLHNIPLAICGALIAFAIGSTFHVFYRYEFLYYLLMCTAIWYRLSTRPSPKFLRQLSYTEGRPRSAHERPAFANR